MSETIDRGEAWEAEQVRRLRRGDEVKAAGRLRHFCATWDEVRANPWSVSLDDEVLCGECSDDMGVTFDEWPSALEDIPESDRLKCERCNA
jgi:hypothetical protein